MVYGARLARNEKVGRPARPAWRAQGSLRTTSHLDGNRHRTHDDRWHSEMWSPSTHDQTGRIWGNRRGGSRVSHHIVTGSGSRSGRASDVSAQRIHAAPRRTPRPTAACFRTAAAAEGRHRATPPPPSRLGARMVPGTGPDTTSFLYTY